MYRTDADGAVASKPARPAAVDPVGYFTNGTVVDYGFLNDLMDEVVYAITGQGFALDRADSQQLLSALRAGLRTHNDPIGPSVTTSHLLGLLVSATSAVSGTYVLVAASQGCTIDIDTTNCLILACSNATLGGVTNTVTNSAMIGCSTSTLGGFGPNADNIVMLASSGIDDTTFASGAASQANTVFGGGDSVSGWILYGAAGNSGIATSGFVQDNGLDYAELFENETVGEIAPGTMVARRGSKVRRAGPGDRVVGVVSATPTIVGGSDAFGWHGAAQKDEWGRVVIGPDGKTKLNPDFRPGKHVPRLKRPSEWSVVGLVGQMRVAVAADVVADDFLAPGKDGIACKSQVETRIEVMKLLTPGVALCLVR